MKAIIAILGMLMFAVVGAAAATPTNSVPSRVPATIRLPDQFNALQSLQFPSTNLTLLVIADRKGSDQLEAWIAPLYKRFEKTIAIHGLADVSTVPPGLQTLVRNAFQKALSYPVMLDWSGKSVRAITYQPGKANILVIAKDGTILGRATGPVTRGRLSEVIQLIERSLADGDLKALE